ncbi:hypothetical protein NO991_11795 [Pseudoalteromonas sp. DY56-GL22]|uniref:condensin complex protein MksE n=1 Tax=Pseudoalteromonas sp. DY56-GL22 TaxID=2967126 RepID=UPI00352AD492
MNIEQINLKRSIQIYDELTKGRVINRHLYSSSTHSLVDNPLFQELRENLDIYTIQYQMSGHQLIDDGEYFYLIHKKLENNNNQLIKTKVYSSIIVLVRCVTHLQSRLYESIKNVNYGIEIKELNEIKLPEEYLLILEKGKHETLHKAIEFLAERNFLIKTNRDKYVLSNAGLSIVDEIIERQNV